MKSHPQSGLGNQDTNSVAGDGNFSLGGTLTHTYPSTIPHPHTHRPAHQGQSCGAESGMGCDGWSLVRSCWLWWPQDSHSRLGGVKPWVTLPSCWEVLGAQGFSTGHCHRFWIRWLDNATILATEEVTPARGSQCPPKWTSHPCIPGTPPRSVNMLVPLLILHPESTGADNFIVRQLISFAPQNHTKSFASHLQ